MSSSNRGGRKFSRVEIQRLVLSGAARALQQGGVAPTPRHKQRLLRAHLRLAALLAEQAGISEEAFALAAARQFRGELGVRAELSPEDVTRLRLGGRDHVKA